MALYGSIPFMLGHSKDKTAGVFWMNAAETWIDIEKIESTSGSSRRTTRTHWYSEAGVLDLFVFLGPTHRDIFKQYSSLVGTTALPQSFSIGYHQCRWNYISQKDVIEVDAGFETHEIPYDVLWLDIEHTNGKRYFTWDPKQFPDPFDMQLHLANKGRKVRLLVLFLCYLARFGNRVVTGFIFHKHLDGHHHRPSYQNGPRIPYIQRGYGQELIRHEQPPEAV